MNSSSESFDNFEDFDLDKFADFLFQEQRLKKDSCTLLSNDCKTDCLSDQGIIMNSKH